MKVRFELTLALVSLMFGYLLIHPHIIPKFIIKLPFWFHILLNVALIAYAAYKLPQITLPAFDRSRCYGAAFFAVVYYFILKFSYMAICAYFNSPTAVMGTLGAIFLALAVTILRLFSVDQNVLCDWHFDPQAPISRGVIFYTLVSILHFSVFLVVAVRNDYWGGLEITPATWGA